MCILDRPNASLILPFFDSIPLFVNGKPGFEKQLEQCLLRHVDLILVLAGAWYDRERTKVEFAVHVEDADGDGDMPHVIELVCTVDAPAKDSRYDFC